MDKRGIAPLVATILLIVLAVGLGVVVMNFGRAQIEDVARCSINLGFNLVELNDQLQVCLDKPNNQLYFVAENGGNIMLEGMRMRAIGSEAILVTDLSEKVDKLGTLMKYVSYGYSKYGDVKQFKLTPKVSLYGREEFCTEQAIVVENVRECIS